MASGDVWGGAKSAHDLDPAPRARLLVLAPHSFCGTVSLLPHTRVDLPWPRPPCDYLEH